MKSILSKSFQYVPAASTDIRKTFAKIRRQQKEAEARKQEASKNVRAIKVAK